MTDPAAENEDAREAAAMGEKPDLGHVEDALKKALEGTDSGSDTRAGSLRGGSASGSEIDPDQDVINADIARQGREMAETRTRPSGGPEQARKSTGQPGDDVDAPTG
ncbi:MULTISPECIES: ribonuclease [unclassified Brevundimonas]|uniref:ribonuclease n=1 Tax=unclassified Brevundimonas TaxID=2622653 RepID=UPI000E9C2ECA|nr:MULTISPECIES: ribonuclease [unclassified Brevundimonas]HBY44047.1 ribonuclease [Brevundimonas sp.]